MWSFGLIIYEMARVFPLYPARDERDLLEMLRVTLGKPSISMLEKAKKINTFYDNSGKAIPSEKSKVPKGLRDKYRPLAVELRDESEEFIDFLEKILVLDASERMTPEQALQHPWIKGPEPLHSMRMSTASFGDVKNISTSKDFSAEMECDNDSPTVTKRLPRMSTAVRTQNSKKLINA
mmetsp:Transcript_20790/g.28051  ORF Transcript_20790/g.28051 Transcript_20790/m.28051 type:complete len:179 (+) Transcript_20790:2-538(+)|eukprot:CAMPEP_0185598108 /NCGR_PEP_ID=MMETSP0434-20130131/81792_1 /TAXON_ID=626734 ORGANISM="Favella taraikaensis, Strain Fe Narragansett Bay" /NCGR_SAMPLE_ID=MMETSP0434 /ASSEMBLY_ACC=CAM_ASM_000379 /LENGTH=178 /DNA_ID=CAMNT_0028227011 /DNA_START=1159 /DNA_END=1695 /DNA_ORIENTATION=+